MGKGRRSNPSAEDAGNWYKHRNCTNHLDIGPRSLTTSTGFMLNNQRAERGPANPPQPFQEKQIAVCHAENPFSSFDNRNTIQLKGEYLGDGKDTRMLGRRLYTEPTSIHRTQRDYLKHHTIRTDPLYTQNNKTGEAESFFHSNYMLSHQYRPTKPAESKRFAKQYNDPSTGTQELQTTTVKQFDSSKGELPYRTPNQTLVSTIEPFVKHNAWKYAYNGNGKYDIYPKVWGDRCATNIGNSKFIKRKVLVEKVSRECTI